MFQIPKSITEDSIFDLRPEKISGRLYSTNQLIENGKLHENDLFLERIKTLINENKNKVLKS